MRRPDEVIRTGRARRSYRTEQSPSKGHVNRKLRVVFKSRPRANKHALSGARTHTCVSSTNTSGKKPKQPKKLKKKPTTSGVRERAGYTKKKRPCSIPIVPLPRTCNLFSLRCANAPFCFLFMFGFWRREKKIGVSRARKRRKLGQRWRRKENKENTRFLQVWRGPRFCFPSPPPPPSRHAGEKLAIFLPYRAPLSTCERFCQIRYESAR